MPDNTDSNPISKTKKVARKLNTASGVFFLSGLVVSKLKFVPVISTVIGVVSLLAYLIGYVFWFVASLYYPDYAKKMHAWYGFARFKQQMQFSAILGTVAMIMLLASSSLILPGSIVFLISNIIWTTGEYHRLQHPPKHETEYSTKRQKDYFRYAILATIVSLVSMAAALLAITLPLYAPLIVVVSSTIGTCLTLIALGYLLRAIFKKYPPDLYASIPETDNEYEEGDNRVSPALSIQPAPSPTPSPTSSTNGSAHSAPEGRASLNFFTEKPDVSNNGAPRARALTH